MGCGALVFVALGLLAAPSLATKKFNITIGYLPVLTGDLRDKQGLTISGALSLALEELNNGTTLLPDVDILLEWYDTKYDKETATRRLLEMYSSGVVAFFGPEGRCESEANIAHSKNLPMISYKCADYHISKLPNVASLEPPATQVTKSVISLLRYYRWNKFSIIYEESWKTVALTLENNARENNMTVNHQRPVFDQFKCCEEELACCSPGQWYQLIQDTKHRTRIYVFLGSAVGLIDMMSAMETHQLFMNGEYMVVFVDMMSYSPYEASKYLIRPEDRVFSKALCPDTVEFKKRAQSLLVVVSSEPSGGYEEFNNQVRRYNTLPPFNFPDIFSKYFSKHVSIYAAYLYDSVRLYAKALDELIREDTQEEKLTYDKLVTIATNGSRIVARMIKNTPYKSVSGVTIRLDDRGDSEGNFSMLAFKPVEFGDGHDNCAYSMTPVGHFQHKKKAFPEYKLNPRMSIDWPDSVKPEDEPSCGFLNEKCSNTGSQVTFLVVAGSLAVALFCTFIVAMVCLLLYRKRRIERRDRRIPRERNRLFAS